MSVENHPNVHVIQLMMDIDAAIMKSLRGEGTKLSRNYTLNLAREIAENVESRVDRVVEMLDSTGRV